MFTFFVALFLVSTTNSCGEYLSAKCFTASISSSLTLTVRLLFGAQKVVKCFLELFDDQQLPDANTHITHHQSSETKSKHKAAGWKSETASSERLESSGELRGTAESFHNELQR